MILPYLIQICKDFSVWRVCWDLRSHRLYYLLWKNCRLRGQFWQWACRLFCVFWWTYCLHIRVAEFCYAACSVPFHCFLDVSQKNVLFNLLPSYITAGSSLDVRFALYISIYNVFTTISAHLFVLRSCGYINSSFYIQSSELKRFLFDVSGCILIFFHVICCLS